MTDERNAVDPDGRDDDDTNPEERPGNRFGVPVAAPPAERHGNAHTRNTATPQATRTHQF